MEVNNATQETLGMPRIGDKAPNFIAQTTKGVIEFSDFAKDKW